VKPSTPTGQALTFGNGVQFFERRAVNGRFSLVPVSNDDICMLFQIREAFAVTGVAVQLGNCTPSFGTPVLRINCCSPLLDDLVPDEVEHGQWDILNRLVDPGHYDSKLQQAEKTAITLLHHDG
jgi:hypothetical protein